MAEIIFEGCRDNARCAYLLHPMETRQGVKDREEAVEEGHDLLWMDLLGHGSEAFNQEVGGKVRTGRLWGVQEGDSPRPHHRRHKAHPY